MRRMEIEKYIRKYDFFERNVLLLETYKLETYTQLNLSTVV